MYNVKKAAILIMICTIISKVLGFGRELALAYFYGASSISDAYLISLTIPGVIFSFIGTGIATGFIPIYTDILNNKSEKEANIYMNNIINILLVVSTIIIAVTLLFTEEIVKLFAAGFNGDTLKLTMEFTKIYIFGIYFSGIIHIFTGFLQINNKFTIPSMIGVVFNILVIVAIIIGAKSNNYIIIVGTLIAKIIEVIIIIPYVYKQRYRYKFILTFKDENIKKMIYLSIPLILGVSVNQINVLVDRTIASSISIGGISALNYANRLNLFIQGVFVMSIATAMYPNISKMASENNIEGLKDRIFSAISAINILVVPCTIGAIIFSKEIVEILFGRGAFSSDAIKMTSIALVYYSIGMIGFGLREILSRLFYSMQDTKTPMINAAIAMGLNIILNIILAKKLGIGGLALATSISAIVCTILLMINLRVKIGKFDTIGMLKSFSKIIIASIIMGVISKYIYLNIFNIFNQNISLIMSIIIGASVYFIIIYFMKIEELDEVLNSIINKLKCKSS